MRYKAILLVLMVLLVAGMAQAYVFYDTFTAANGTTINGYNDWKCRFFDASTIQSNAAKINLNLGTEDSCEHEINNISVNSIKNVSLSVIDVDFISYSLISLCNDVTNNYNRCGFDNMTNYGIDGYYIFRASDYIRLMAVHNAGGYDTLALITEGVQAYTNENITLNIYLNSSGEQNIELYLQNNVEYPTKTLIVSVGDNRYKDFKSVGLTTFSGSYSTFDDVTINNFGNGTSQFVTPTPLNNTVSNSTNLILSFLCDTGDINMYFDFNQTVPTTPVLTSGGTDATFNATTLVTTEGEYYYMANCGNGTANYSRKFIYDATPPAISLWPDNAFNSTNTTNHIYWNNQTFHINITDIGGSNVSNVTITVTAPNGTYFTTGILNNNTERTAIYNITNITGWPMGNYTVRVDAYDQINHKYLDAYFTRSNLSITYVNTTPYLIAFKDNNLLGYATAREWLDKWVTYEWIWYENNQTNSSGTYNTLPNTILNLANISSNITTDKDKWTFSVRANASDWYTPWVNSSNITVISYAVDNCSTYTTRALNVSFWDINGAPAFPTMQYTVNFGPGSTIIYTYSNIEQSLTNSNMTLCIYPSYANLTAYIQFLYNDTAAQYNYFLYTNLTNVSQKLNLYTQTGTTSVIFTVTDLNSKPLAFYRIQILKFNVGTGAYTTTEILQTDSNGHAIGNIVLNTAYYNILVFDTSNKLVKSDLAVRLTSTTYQIVVAGEQDVYYTDLGNSLGITTSVYYNNATENFVFTWIDPTGNMHMACMRVTNTTYLGTETMSDSCQTSTSGTLLYNLASPKNDTQYLAMGYLKYDYEFPVGYAGFKLPDGYLLWQVDAMGGLFICTLLVIIGIMIALPNAVLGIIYFGVAVIASALLGLIKVVDTSTSVGMGVLSSLILLGIVVIYIGGKQN